MAPVSIAVVRVRWESEKPGPQHCAITYPQCCGGRRDRSRTAGGPTTTRPGPPAPSDMLPVGCPRAAQVGACFKGATAWGNAYPCPERQHHVCCPPGMATLARATGSDRGLCNMEGKRLSMPGTAASRMLPSEHGDIGTRMPLLRGPQGGRCARQSDCHGPTGDRGKVSPLSGSKRSQRRSAGA